MAEHAEYGKEIVAAAVELQKRKARRLSVLGPAGSNSHVVAQDLVDRQTGVMMDRTALGIDFANIFPEIVTAAMQPDSFGLLPIANQIGGIVMHRDGTPRSNLDVIDETRSDVLAKVGLPISHCLMGAEELEAEQLRGLRVFSHIQALTQCTEYIEAMGLVAVETTSTSAAARALADPEQDEAGLAIAPALAAKLYGLQQIARDIGNVPAAQNITTMALIKTPAL